MKKASEIISSILFLFSRTPQLAFGAMARPLLLGRPTGVLTPSVAQRIGATAALRPRHRAVVVAPARHRHRSLPLATANGGEATPPPPPLPPPPQPSSSLSSARAAAKFTAAYINLAGLAAIAAPLSVGAALFGKAATAALVVASSSSASSSSALVPSWLIRVLGVLAVTFGVYYAGAASGKGERGFYESTVVGRVALAASFVLLALFGVEGGGSGNGSRGAAAVAALASAQRTPRFGLLLLAGANAVGACSMALALRRDDKKMKDEQEARRKKAASVEGERDW
jgi:hypothetical protein